MGARPVAAFLSLGLPKKLNQPRTSDSWLERYFDGFFALAESTGTPLAGGDLAQSPVFAADIVLLGAVRRGKALLRSGAKPGHRLYVTGALGGSAAGLAQLAKRSRRSKTKIPELPSTLEPGLAAHLIPQPRLAVGKVLARRGLASAAIDISDGLSTDLAHLCEESCVAAEIEADLLPVYPEATLKQALHGGEDYELLFSAPPKARIPNEIDSVPITCIGRVTAHRKGHPLLTLLTSRGQQPLEPRGWEHFA
jgi:thiamine-monophosphate kinase